MFKRIPSASEESQLDTQRPKFIEDLFKSYYTPLVKFIYRMLKDADASEDIVQDVFVKVWNNRSNLDQNRSIKSYLYRSAINTAINYLEKNKRTGKVDNLEKASQLYFSNTTEENLNLKELEKKVSGAIDTLPPRCKAIFIMSRYEELSYKEIAEALDLSVKTVENQMGKALSIMREELKVYIKQTK